MNSNFVYVFDSSFGKIIHATFLFPKDCRLPLSQIVLAIAQACFISNIPSNMMPMNANSSTNRTNYFVLK